MDTRAWTMGHYPVPDRPAHLSDVNLVAEARLFNHVALADRLAVLAGLCKCNVGVQVCEVHPGRVRLRTKEEKIAFRKAWDARTVED